MEHPAPRRHEPLELNRTFLFLLVVGLIIVAWQRNRGGAPAAPEPAPASETKLGAAMPTNSVAGSSLVSFGQTGHK